VGYLFALLGALLFGANGSLAKLLVEGGLTATQLTLFRSLGTAVLAGLVLLITDRAAFRLSPRLLLVMAVLGIGGVALVQATYAAALAYLPVGVTLLLQYTGVLIVALVAFLVFKEKVRARLWVAIGLVLLGLVAVARPWEARLDPTGVALAIGAAVTLAFYFLVGERQVGRTSPLAVSFWTMTFASLFWGLFSGWWELDAGTFARPLDVGGQWGSWELPLGIPLLVTVVVGSFLAFLLFFSALKHLSATAAGIAASAEVVFAFAVAWVWLGETLDPVGIAGAAVVLAGILLAQTARQTKVIVDADLVLPAEPGVGGRT
jgi:drug/metabolite transporter (DMT)-like permease